MKLRSIINEMFDKILPYEWIKQTTDEWDAQFIITTKLGKTEINVTLDKAYDDGSEAMDDYEHIETLYDVWEAAFSATILDNNYDSPIHRASYPARSYDILNSGSASTILGTVMAAIKEFIDVKKPEYLVFSAKGGSRINAYKTMMNKFLPSGWSYKTVSTTYTRGGDDIFIATRGNIDESDKAVVDIMKKYL